MNLAENEKTENKHTVDFLKLLEITIEQEEKTLELHQKRIIFFKSIIFSILGVIGVGIVNANHISYYFLFTLALLLIYAMCDNGIETSKRTFTRYARILSTRAKIEAILGLHSSVKNFLINGQDFKWSDEPIIPAKHLTHIENSLHSENLNHEGGCCCKNKSCFVSRTVDNSYHGITEKMFSNFKITVLLLIVFCLYRIICLSAT